MMNKSLRGRGRESSHKVFLKFVMVSTVCGDSITGRSALGFAPVAAFSSEVDTGSHQESASKQESKIPFRFNQSRKGLGRDDAGTQKRAAVSGGF
jgi:hypothetical protein